MITGFGSKIAGLAGIAAPVGAAIGGVLAAVKGIGEVGAAFGEIDRIAKSADSFGVTTEEMVGLEHAAELSGVSTELLGKAMKKATRDGTELATIADKIAAAESPTDRAKIAFDALGKSGQDLLPLLSEGGDAIRAMMAEGADLAGFSREDAAKVEEANDAISRMKLAFTGVARDIAISLAPMIDKVAVGVKTLGTWTRDAFTQITPIIEQTGNVIISGWNAVRSATTAVFGGLLGSAQTTFSDVAGFILDAAIMAEFAFANIGDIATLAWDTVKLGALGFWNDLSFMFTDQIPAVLTWFGDNWQNIFFTAVDYALTLFINLGTNIRALWSGVLDFIAGKGFNVDWTPLTEGAVSAISSLPEIPERVATDAEKQLTASIDAMNGRLLDGMATHLQTRRGELLGPDGETATSTTPTDIDSAGVATDMKGPAALTRGSSEAFSAVLSAMRSTQRDPSAEVALTTKEMLAEQRRTTEQLRKLVTNPQVEIVTGGS